MRVLHGPLERTTCRAGRPHLKKKKMGVPLALSRSTGHHSVARPHVRHLQVSLVRRGILSTCATIRQVLLAHGMGLLREYQQMRRIRIRAYCRNAPTDLSASRKMGCEPPADVRALNWPRLPATALPTIAISLLMRMHVCPLPASRLSLRRQKGQIKPCNPLITRLRHEKSRDCTYL